MGQQRGRRRGGQWRPSLIPELWTSPARHPLRPQPPGWRPRRCHAGRRYLPGQPAGPARCALGAAVHAAPCCSRRSGGRRRRGTACHPCRRRHAAVDTQRRQGHSSGCRTDGAGQGVCPACRAAGAAGAGRAPQALEEPGGPVRCRSQHQQGSAGATLGASRNCCRSRRRC